VFGVPEAAARASWAARPTGAIMVVIPHTTTVLGRFVKDALALLSFFVKTTLLSLVALVIVVGFLQRIDRWEPEPWTTKLAMFLWGGGVATLSAMMQPLYFSNLRIAPMTASFWKS